MRSKRYQEEDGVSYWQSYSDMMAALLLVFVLIISFTMLQAKRQYEDKQNKLLEQQTLLEEQQRLLEEQELLLLEQQATLEEQKDIMKQQQERIDSIVGIRTDLVTALQLEFSGSDLVVSVDPQTGAITLDSSILFDSGKSSLKMEGTTFLKKFLPRYLNILLNEPYREYISEIIIEGHTDTDGTYMQNLSLSQGRALSVASFCLNDFNTLMTAEQTEELRGIVTANGKSFSNPIYNEDGTVNKEASRRVEFKFRLKDEEMISQMASILSEKQGG